MIIGMHHDQDMRNMGGLWKYMPITWITSLFGSLALIGFPLSGFYSKDTIIEAVHFSHIPEPATPTSASSRASSSPPSTPSACTSWCSTAESASARRMTGTTTTTAITTTREVSADHHHGLAPGQKPHESPGGHRAAGPARDPSVIIGS